MSRRPARFTEADIPPEFAERLKHVTGHVYFIVAGDANAVKIGFSRNPGARFTNLSTGSPVPLVFYGSIPANRNTETALHQKFKHLRMDGEWFRGTPELYDHIEDLADDNWELQTFWEISRGEG